MPSPPAISIAPRRLSTTLPLPSCALAASPMPVNTPSPPCATTSLTAPVPRRMSRRRSIWSPTSPKPPPADSSGPVQCATVEPDVVRRYRYVLRTGEGTPGRSRFLQVVFEVLSLVHEAVNECCTARPDLTLKRVVWRWYVPPFPLHDPSDELLVPLRRFDDRGAHPGLVRQAPDGFIIHGHEYLRPRLFLLVQLRYHQVSDSHVPMLFPQGPVENAGDRHEEPALHLAGPAIRRIWADRPDNCSDRKTGCAFGRGHSRQDCFWRRDRKR